LHTTLTPREPNKNNNEEKEKDRRPFLQSLQLIYKFFVLKGRVEYLKVGGAGRTNQKTWTD
jgi:hypothetical protein